MAVAVGQFHGFKPPVRTQRCRLLSFTNLDFFMLEPNQVDLAQSSEQASLSSSGFHRSISTPCLTLTPKVEEDFNKYRPRIEIIGGRSAPRVRALVVEVAIATATGVDPVPLTSGLGGAYLLRSRNGDNIAVAKPIDEEPLALNNPKGFTGRMLGQPGLKRSVKIGEAGMRELAAYLLDHNGFAGVPPTALVKFTNVMFNTNNSSIPAKSPAHKIASLQRFVDHDSDAGDLGPSGFSVSSVHRIAILDVRLLNIDRHSGNMLVGKYEHDKYSLGAADLVPIDHGLCLPEWLDDPYFEWLHWPQALVPFSEAEMEYIMNLNPIEDAKLLKTELPCLAESSIRVLVVCTIFLKKAALAGLCLGDIGEMMTRDSHGGEETMSVLESICVRAKETVFLLSNDIDCGNFMEEDTEEDDPELFQFDEECEDCSNSQSNFTQCLSSAAKPPLPPKAQAAKPATGMLLKKLCPLLELECPHVEGRTVHKCPGVIDIKAHDNRKPSNLFKSVSFAPPGRKDEIEGVSFGELKEDEWDFFLEMFERMLPEVFEERKNTSITQRVGSA